MSITKDVSVRLAVNGADDVKAQLTSVTEQADRLGTKTATLQIDAHDEDFMVEASEVLAKAKELGATKVRIAVSADDEHAKVALDEIRAKADELGLKKVNIKVNVDTGEAEAKLAALKAEGEGGGGNGGFLSSLMGGSDPEGILGNAGSLLSFGGDSLLGTGGGVGSVAALGALAQGLSAVSVAGLGLGAAFAPIAGSIMPKVSAEWSKWSASIAATPDAKKAIGAASNAFNQLLDALTPVVITMMPELTRLFKDIGQSAESGGLNTFLQWLSTNAPKAFDAVAHGVTIAGNAIHAMQPWISAVADVFKIFFALLDAGFDLIGALIDVFTGNWSAAGNKIKAVGGNLGNVFKDLWNLIENLFGKGVSFIAGIPGKIVSALLPMDEKLLSLAETALGKFLNGMENGAEKGFNYVRGIPGRILGALGSLGGLLYGAGTAIIRGLLNGLESEFNTVKNFVSGIASWIADHKGPISYDATLLIPHGQAVMGGLVKGLQDGMPGLNGQLAAVTNTISGTKVPSVAGGGAGGAVTVNFNGVVTDPDGTARKLQQMLVNLKRHNGGRSLFGEKAGSYA